MHKNIQAINFSYIWLAMFVLSASGMMMETISYRQWRLLMGTDSLHVVLPLVMVGLAAGAIAFYLLNRKSVENNDTLTSTLVSDFTSKLLIAYAAISFISFLLMPLSTRLESAKSLLSVNSLILQFILFGCWGYANSEIFHRGHDKIFKLYIANLLGTIWGSCVAIAIMDSYGSPKAMSLSIAAAILTAWAWVVTKSITRRRAYIVTTVALCGIITAFALTPRSLTLFRERELPVWFDSNSFSQLTTQLSDLN